MTTFRAPTLAASLMPSNVEHTDENIYDAMCKLRYPVMATRKIDGIRGLRFNGTLLSRTLKQIPSRVICDKAKVMPGGFDVEICRDDLSYNENESIIMRANHPDAHTMTFHVLDHWDELLSYAPRMVTIENIMKDMPPFVKFEYPTFCKSPEELFSFLQQVETEDGEGICFRTPTSPYFQKRSKENRCTLKEQWLVKFARFIREEGVIIGFEEQMCNSNRAEQDAFGKTKRSSSQAFKDGKDTLGVLVLRLPDGNTVRVGTGLNNMLRRKIWYHQDKYIGRTVTFKHKPVGRKNKPRSPIFVGFREEGY